MESSVPTHNPPFVYDPISIDGQPFQEEWLHYHDEYRLSLEKPEEYWGKIARLNIDWFAPFTRVMGGSFAEGDVNWFPNGKLNVCYNCVDRHLESLGDRPAIVWEGDELNSSKEITFNQLVREVSRIANVLKMKGVKKGDVVTLYMPMVPELAYSMLACARIGAVHSIVFAGFSAESLRGRIVDCNSKFVFTSDEGRRGGKLIHLKTIVNQVL